MTDLTEQTGKNGVAGGRYVADPDDAAQCGTVVPSQALGALRTGEQVFRFGQRRRSRCGQAYAARVAHNKPHPNFIFQLLDLFGKRRLSYEKLFRLPAIHCRFSDGDKIAQMPRFRGRHDILTMYGTHI